MIKRPRMIAVLPTLLTLGNAACGFGAITFAAKVGPEPLEGNHLLIAALLIFLAMLFDMLDGSAARWAKQTTDFGGELDSLCDGISFGVAPAFLMIQFIRHPHSQLEDSWIAFQYHPRLLWVIAVLYVICALLRLARFNVETDEDDAHNHFSGLPSPAAAGTVASLPIAMHGIVQGLPGLLGPLSDETSQAVAEWLAPVLKLILPIVTLAVACLMVSRIRYSHEFNQLFRGHKSRQHLIQLVFTIFAVFIVREMAVPLIFCYFAFSSPLRALWKELVAPRLHRGGERPSRP